MLSVLIELNESVTWEAKHFEIVQRLSSKIIVMKYPDYFIDERVFGTFKSLKHQHIFESKGGETPNLALNEPCFDELALLWLSLP